MITEEKKAKIIEKWNDFRECNSRKRKKLLNRSFAFCVEYDCGVDDVSKQRNIF